MDYYEGNQKKKAIAFCSKCQMPLSGSRFTYIGEQPCCPACEDELIFNILQHWGFKLRLEADFGEEEGRDGRQYG